jgi:hypothetical protein
MSTSSCVSISNPFELTFPDWWKDLHVGCVPLGKPRVNDLEQEMTEAVSDRRLPASVPTLRNGVKKKFSSIIEMLCLAAWFGVLLTITFW